MNMSSLIIFFIYHVHNIWAINEETSKFSQVLPNSTRYRVLSAYNDNHGPQVNLNKANQDQTVIMSEATCILNSGTFCNPMDPLTPATCPACICQLPYTLLQLNAGWLCYNCTEMAAARCTNTQYFRGCDESKKRLGSCDPCPMCQSGQYNRGCVGLLSPGVCVDCPICPVGMFASGCTWVSSGVCNPCPVCSAGTYSTGCSGTSSGTCSACDFCSAGKYAFCPSGSVITGSTNPADSFCLSCPAGKYSSSLNALTDSTCLSCPAGTYSSMPGLSSLARCSACSAGKFSTGSGIVSDFYCSLCSAGTYSTASEAFNS